MGLFNALRMAGRGVSWAFGGNRRMATLPILSAVGSGIASNDIGTGIASGATVAAAMGASKLRSFDRFRSGIGGLISGRKTNAIGAVASVMTGNPAMLPAAMGIRAVGRGAYLGVREVPAIFGQIFRNGRQPLKHPFLASMTLGGLAGIPFGLVSGSSMKRRMTDSVFGGGVGVMNSRPATGAMFNMNTMGLPLSLSRRSRRIM